MAVSSNASATFNLPAQVISIKLDGTNFLAWSAQLIPLFRRDGLMGIVNGSNPYPPQYSSDELCDQGVLNSAYVVWQYKDQTVLSWIVSSLSPSIVSLFMQGSMSCQSFLDEVKSLSNELSAVGKPVEDSDLILSVLNGLNSSFHSFVTTYMLLAKEKSMSFSDFHAEMLNYDLMQKFHNHTIQPETERHPPTELAAMVAEANTTYLNQHQCIGNGAGPHDGDTLMTRPSDRGLYPINLQQVSSSKFHVFSMTVGVKASTTTWHCRLGHPSSSTLHNVLHNYSLPGFCCYDPSSQRVYISRNVIFDEIVFPARVQSPLMDSGSSVPSIVSPPHTTPIIPTDHNFSIPPDTSSDINSPVSSSPSNILEPSSSAPSSPAPSYHVVTRSQTGHLRPRIYLDFHLYFSTHHPIRALHAGVIIFEPRSYAQAATILEWHLAMECESQALLKNET
ncbi:hypothetical protein CK203_063445 [Vitis vinifera]|uniref:GAG-pre-integrase domain-containing protein n=1 Tax=Vitis vinifera TaxID=29760 RepID=A0A438FQV6_VITVI|nr:hypothetical protein CK203_063445 [Vitis vinifera]